MFVAFLCINGYHGPKDPYDTMLFLIGDDDFLMQTGPGKDGN